MYDILSTPVKPYVDVLNIALDKATVVEQNMEELILEKGHIIFITA